MLCRDGLRRELAGLVRVHYPTVMPSSAPSTSTKLCAAGAFVAGLVLAAPSAGAQGFAPGQVVDEGTFVVTRPGLPTETEAFRIVHIDNGQLQATGQVTGGPRRATSRIITDSVGTPVEYQLAMFDGSARAATSEVHALARGGRLSALLRNRRGEESMHEYPLAAGRSLMLDDELVHLFYFASLGKRTGGSYTLAAHGLEPVAIDGKSVTGTRYSLSNGSATRDFWVDANGMLLRVENPATKLVAMRQELPR
jgi:hypothetical protein